MREDMIMSMMTSRALQLLAAGTLALASPAVAAETTGRSVASELIEAWDTGRASGDVPFPHLPWMTADRPSTAEGLLGPRVATLGPFLLQPEIPASGFSEGASGSRR
jgi:hypothetical protein